MKFRTLLLATTFVHASAFAQSVILDDDFSDGEVGTNRAGTGSGFYSRVATGGAVAEVNGAVRLISNLDGGARAFVISNESVDTTTQQFVSYIFEGVGFAITPDDSRDGETHRTYLGVRGKPTGNNDTIERPGVGFYVEFGFGGLSGNPDGTSTFFYMSADNTPTPLATWTFDTLKILDSGVTNTELNVEITLNQTDWSIEIQGDTVNNAPIRYSGTHAEYGIVNDITTGHAFLGNQSESPNLEMSAKRVSIPAPTSRARIPEPATFVVLASTLALGVTLLRRKRS
ncbi:MAG: hypothetical protein ACSHYA_16340 [Opitutaceae bacterium]